MLYAIWRKKNTRHSRAYHCVKCGKNLPMLIITARNLAHSKNVTHSVTEYHTLNPVIVFQKD